MAKKILFKEDAKKALQNGVNKLADAVGSTMGAAGRTVIISNHYNIDPTVTKDGITVAASIILEDRIENIGAQLVRSASKATADSAGDGTTQTVVLAQSIINDGLDAVAKGGHVQEIKAGIDKAVDCVVNCIRDMAMNIGDRSNDIKNIATISANNDVKIGQLIADAYAKIGNNGLLLIEESGVIETTIEVVEGVEISRGYISPEFVNDKSKMRVVYDNPLFLIADYSINTMKDLMPIMEQLHAAGLLEKHPIVLVATDFNNEAYGSMIINQRKGILKTCLIKPPAAYRKENLEDYAIVTGGTVICDENGLKMENALLKHLGSAARVIVTENSTTIIQGGGDEVKLTDHKNAIQVQMNDMKDERLKDEWRLRLGRISGNVGIIKVGAATDVEMKERKDRVDDACRAVKSSIEEGVVVGGGVALLRCLKALDKLMIKAKGDEIIGIVIIARACKAPLMKMLLNGGLDPQILESVTQGNDNYGYNIKAKEFQDLFENGVIDPAKVIRCAIQNAASVAGAIITSDCLLAEVFKD